MFKGMPNEVGLVMYVFLATCSPNQKCSIRSDHGINQNRSLEFDQGIFFIEMGN